VFDSDRRRPADHDGATLALKPCSITSAWKIRKTVRQYLVELEQQNPAEAPVHEQEQVSTTDPDSTYATKGGTPARVIE
jgi:hypothetical protein